MTVLTATGARLKHEALLIEQAARLATRVVQRHGGVVTSATPLSVDSPFTFDAPDTVISHIGVTLAAHHGMHAQRTGTPQAGWSSYAVTLPR